MHNVVSNGMHLGSPLSVLLDLEVSRQIKDARQTVTEFEHSVTAFEDCDCNFCNLTFDI